MKLYIVRKGVHRKKDDSVASEDWKPDKHFLGCELVSAAMLHNYSVVDMYTIIIWKICHLTSLLKNLTQTESKPLWQPQARAHSRTPSHFLHLSIDELFCKFNNRKK